jgi:hypothetical protein
VARLPILFLAATLAACAGSASAQDAPSSAPSRQDLSRLCEQAWKQADHEALRAALTDAWSADPEWARERCYQAVLHGSGPQRAVALHLLAEHADPKSLAQAAAALPDDRFPDERRILIRAIGPRLEDLKRIDRFVDSQDALTAAAAIRSLADAGQPAAVDLFISRLPDAPASQGNWEGDDDDILAMAMHGALAGLTGCRFDDCADARRWWKTTGRKAGDEAPSLPPAALRRGETYYPTPSFDVYFRIGGVTEPPADGPLEWKKLASVIEQCADNARSAAEPILGRVHMPPIRLILCDETEFAAHAGISFRGGVAKGNEMIVRAADPVYLRPTFTHEYVHIIHGAHAEKQPRWLQEGLAESLTYSRSKCRWDAPGMHAAGLAPLVRRGAFTELANWTGGAASGDQEGPMYALAHLAVDYLRYGDHPAPQTQLTMLMGVLSRGTSDTEALAEVYGMTAAELDGRLAAWISGR